MLLKLVISKMPVDKFGHHSHHSFVQSKVTFPHTFDGNIDAQNAKICNLQEPTTNADAATKKYVDERLAELLKSHDMILQQHVSDIQDLAIGINAIKNELHKTTVPTLEAQIGSLQNKTNEIDMFISRNPPKQARDIATKKYVDDAIVITKDFIRREFKNNDVALRNEVTKEIADSASAKQIASLSKDIVDIKSKIQTILTIVDIKAR